MPTHACNMGIWFIYRIIFKFKNVRFKIIVEQLVHLLLLCVYTYACLITVLFSYIYISSFLRANTHFVKFSKSLIAEYVLLGSLNAWKPTEFLS